MEWVKIDENVSEEDKPKFLTEKELHFISNSLPETLAADSSSANLINTQIKKWIFDSLSRHKICPSSISEIIEEIRRNHIQSVVVPGTPDGLIEAGSIGATTTQLTLNTFHVSGSGKSVRSGIDSLKDILSAKESITNEVCIVHYRDKSISYEDVLNSRSYIVGSYIYDFISDYEIDKVESFEKFSWSGFVELFGSEIPNSEVLLRLHLNVDEMYKHKVTIRKLVQIIENNNKLLVVCDYGTVSDGIIDIYPKLEISENIEYKKDFSRELMETSFLELIVISEFKTTRVKGIKNLKSLVPVPVSILTFIESQDKVYKSDLYNDKLKKYENYLEDLYFLTLSEKMKKKYGVDFNKFIEMFQLCDIIIYGLVKNKLLIHLPDDRFYSSIHKKISKYNNHYYILFNYNTELKIIKNKFYFLVKKSNIFYKDEQMYEKLDENLSIVLSSIINLEGTIYKQIPKSDLIQVEEDFYYKLDSRIKINERNPVEYVSQKISEDESLYENENIFKDRTQLMKTSQVVYSMIEGQSNPGLSNLLNLYKVDKNRTTCNNMNTIFKLFGIEAVRKFIMRSMNEIISESNSYVNPSGIILIAESNTSRGIPKGINFGGISRQPVGHISLATVETPFSVFTKSAMYNKSEDIRNVSAAIVVGERIKIGTGYFDVGQYINENGVEKLYINDDLFINFEKDQSSDKIDFQNIELEELEFDIDNFDNTKVSFDRRQEKGYEETDETDFNGFTVTEVEELNMEVTAQDKLTSEELSEIDNQKKISVLKEKIKTTGIYEIIPKFEKWEIYLPSELKNILQKNKVSKVRKLDPSMLERNQ
jgi:hypothetical protein